MSGEDPILIHVPAQEGYNRWSEVYDGEDNPLILLEQRQVEALIGNVAGLSMIDIGCGTGRHALYLSGAGATVTGIDFSEGMLGKAREKPQAEKVRFLQHDLAQPMPFAEEEFDAATCFLVLDHIQDLPGLFSEMHRICRTNGFVLISVMHPAMNLKGVQARFIDPATGVRVCLASATHQVSDYLMAAIRAGLMIEHISEHLVDDDLAQRSPRGAKYLGWPLLLMMRLRKR